VTNRFAAHPKGHGELAIAFRPSSVLMSKILNRCTTLGKGLLRSIYWSVSLNNRPVSVPMRFRVKSPIQGNERLSKQAELYVL
jgi:hypothetical protein